MHRREFLGSLGGATTGLTAGCFYMDDIEYRSTDTRTAERISRRGSPKDICQRSIRPNVQIDAIDDPVFGTDWADSNIPDPYNELTENTTVVGLDRADSTQAYPLSILSVHEIVNAKMDIPLLITYCPLCRSAVVAGRRIEGETKTFRVSGLLWRPPAGAIRKGISAADFEGQAATVDIDANLVMYDEETGSYWSQLLAAAICGPLTGYSLQLIPYTVSTWGDWRDKHPQTEVLLPPTISYPE